MALGVSGRVWYGKIRYFYSFGGLGAPPGLDSGLLAQSYRNRLVPRRIVVLSALGLGPKLSEPASSSKNCGIISIGPWPKAIGTG